MATTEERLAALEAKLAQLTATTPTTYYTHQYSGEEIDNAVSRALPNGAIDQAAGTFVRPNLLDNWYFANPVNQRGATSYIGSASTGIDRWWQQYNTDVTVQDGYITISGQWQIEQRFENPIDATNITVALLSRNCTSRFYVSAAFDDGTETEKQEIGNSESAFTLKAVTFNQRAKKVISISFSFVNNIGSIDLLAAKLELGSRQTLAHQDADGNWVLNEIPDYGEQLRRCQRYAIKIGKDTAGVSSLVGFALCTSSTLASAFISLPVSMRTKPIVTLKNVYLSLGSSVVAVTNITVYENTQNGIYCALSVSGGLTVGQTVAIKTSDGGYIMPSADL